MDCINGRINAIVLVSHHNFNSELPLLVWLGSARGSFHFVGLQRGHKCDVPVSQSLVYTEGGCVFVL